MKYNLYAGLGGSFGGLVYKGTIDVENILIAAEQARALAIEEYEAYEGLYGILSKEDLAESNGLTFENDEEEIEALYIEEMECWLEYNAIPTQDDNDIPEEEIYEL